MERFVNSPIAESGEYWWNPRRPDQPSLWNSKIELSEKFFKEIIRHPMPIDMNTLTALKRCSLGLDLYMWLVYRTFNTSCLATALLAAGIPSVRPEPKKRSHSRCRSKLPPTHPARVEEDQSRLDGTELHHGTGPADPVSLEAHHPIGRASSTRKLDRLVSLSSPPPSREYPL